MKIEDAKVIKHSSHWRAVEEELDNWTQGTYEKMKNCTPEELQGLQATVKAYQEVKRLPQIVIDRE